MKTIRITILWIWCLASVAFADRSLTLAWDANPPAELVTSYEVSVDGKVTATVKGDVITAQVTIPDARTSITVSAVNIGGKGPPSAPLEIPASPSNPKGVRVTAILRTTVSTP